MLASTAGMKKHSKPTLVSTSLRQCRVTGSSRSQIGRRLLQPLHAMQCNTTRKVSIGADPWAVLLGMRPFFVLETKRGHMLHYEMHDQHTCSASTHTNAHCGVTLLQHHAESDVEPCKGAAIQQEGDAEDNSAKQCDCWAVPAAAYATRYHALRDTDAAAAAYDMPGCIRHALLDADAAAAAYDMPQGCDNHALRDADARHDMQRYWQFKWFAGAIPHSRRLCHYHMHCIGYVQCLPSNIKLQAMVLGRWYCTTHPL
jgi:hypothetical protein